MKCGLVAFCGRSFATARAEAALGKRRGDAGFHEIAPYPEPRLADGVPNNSEP